MYHPISVADRSILPRIFNNPFYYSPHSLCVEAAEEVKRHLASHPEWKEELIEGKMFGVLLVETPSGEVGYLAAFSGILQGKNQHPFFVPPVYDLLSPNSFFQVEVAAISAINKTIDELSESKEYLSLKEKCKVEALEIEEKLTEGKKKLKQAKKERDAKRATTTDPAELELLAKMSQYQNGEWKRTEKKLKEQLEQCCVALKCATEKIESLKEERKNRSATLQNELFARFEMLNARGERKNLLEIFRDAPQQYPPAGSGECAGPKLMQYAFVNQFKPLAMAEFWVGRSAKDEVRHEGYFYPACRSKCHPILSFMLQGLAYEKNALEEISLLEKPIERLYEDEYLVVVNKPSGVLSTPGKGEALHIGHYLKDDDGIEPVPVHRLDIATSGILVLATEKEVLGKLQIQFQGRTVKKRYVALLERLIDPKSGAIELPLVLDVNDRPRQKVDFVYGKPAITGYKVIGQEDGRTRIVFYPHTGRTHQLRIHSAHIDGLNAQIVGDTLYGKSSDRLYLHAEFIEFEHPITKGVIKIECKAAF